MFHIVTLDCTSRPNQTKCAKDLHNKSQPEQPAIDCYAPSLISDNMVKFSSTVVTVLHVLPWIYAEILLVTDLKVIQDTVSNYFTMLQYDNAVTKITPKY